MTTVMNVVDVASIPSRSRTGTTTTRQRDPLIAEVLKLTPGQGIELVFSETTEPDVRSEGNVYRKATYDDFCNRKVSLVSRKGVVPFNIATRRVKNNNRLYIYRPATTVATTAPNEALPS